MKAAGATGTRRITRREREREESSTGLGGRDVGSKESRCVGGRDDETKWASVDHRLMEREREVDRTELEELVSRMKMMAGRWRKMIGK